MDSLKLMAFDEDDLQILSAHAQDALVRVEEMAWLPGRNRFVTLMNRFDWSGAMTAEAGGRRSYQRRRSALRFERVLKVSAKNIRLGEKGQVLELLAIRFRPDKEPPSGTVELVFAEDRALRLKVECLEAALADLGPGWRARSKPSHEE